MKEFEGYTTWFMLINHLILKVIIQNIKLF